MDTRQVIDKYYASSAAGDWDAWLGLFADNYLMEDIMGGNLRGLDTLRQHVDMIKKGYSRFLMQPVHILVQGDQGFVAWHFQGANASGVPIDGKGANYFEVKNGKIAHIAEFFNPAPFAPFLNQFNQQGKPA